MTKKEKEVLLMASRPCGLSYRAVISRDLLHTCRSLVLQGQIRLIDKGENVKFNRFIYRSTLDA